MADYDGINEDGYDIENWYETHRGESISLLDYIRLWRKQLPKEEAPRVVEQSISDTGRKWDASKRWQYPDSTFDALEGNLFALMIYWVREKEKATDDQQKLKYQKYIDDVNEARRNVFER